MLSSSSSSSSEDEFEIFEVFALTKGKFKERNNLFDAHNDSDFRKIYRVSKQTALKVIEIFGPSLEHISNRNRPISAANQILVTLRYFATGAYLKVLEEHHDIHRSTITRIVRRTCKQFVNYSKNFIHLPKTPDKLLESQRKFFVLNRFPHVIGAINCTHVNIQCPSAADSVSFKNKAGAFSINVQIISDADNKILDIITHSGASDENSIFETSQVRQDFVNGKYPGCFLLGNSNYNCTNYLLTPVGNPKTSAEYKYNNSHNITWNSVEKTIHLWKRRFSCLTSGMRLYIETIFDVIIGTAVLHNIAIDLGDVAPFDDEEDICDELFESTDNTVQNDNYSIRNNVINKIFNMC